MGNGGTSSGKPHVGFPEKCLEAKMELLVEKGFKVVVVEQYEWGKKLNNNQKVERGIHQIVSKGIYHN
jgi:DNA mismatch repair protein MSH6